MRTCKNCGQTGHDRRNCPTIIELKTSSHSTKPAPEKRRSITDGLDAETLEAIDWYMEQRYPGHKERMKNRASVAEDVDETE